MSPFTELKEIKASVLQSLYFSIFFHFIEFWSGQYCNLKCVFNDKKNLDLFFICFDKPEAISDNPLVEIFHATQIRQSI
jgi:hypothetical protein